MHVVSCFWPLLAGLNCTNCSLFSCLFPLTTDMWPIIRAAPMMEWDGPKKDVRCCSSWKQPSFSWRIYLGLHVSTLSPIIMVQWKMAVYIYIHLKGNDPIGGTQISLNHDYGRKGNRYYLAVIMSVLLRSWLTGISLPGRCMMEAGWTIIVSENHLSLQCCVRCSVSLEFYFMNPDLVHAWQTYRFVHAELLPTSCRCIMDLGFF